MPNRVHDSLPAILVELLVLSALQQRYYDHDLDDLGVGTNHERWEPYPWNCVARGTGRFGLL